MKWTILVAAAAAALAVAAPASATNECRGLKVCVPVQGPWVLAPSPLETQWELQCPRGSIVGGLDAELTNRAIDIVFRATLGSPVNPGISTTNAAVFLARLAAGHDRAASFRPRLGCIPVSGSGARVPTVYAPGTPTVRRVTEIVVRRATLRVVRACAAGEHLVAASNAVGFETIAPPSVSLATDVHVAQALLPAGRVALTIRAGPLARAALSVVQLDLVCAGGS